MAYRYSSIDDEIPFDLPGEGPILKTYSTGSAAQAVHYSDYDKLRVIDEPEGNAQQLWSAEGVKLLSRQITHQKSDSKNDRTGKSYIKTKKLANRPPRSRSFASDVSLEHESHNNAILIDSTYRHAKGKALISSRGVNQDLGLPIKGDEKSKSNVIPETKDPSKKRLLNTK